MTTKNNKLCKLLSIAALTTMAFGASYADQINIKFATNATYPPFVSKNAQGKMIGYDIDVVHAICKDIKAKCSIEDTSFEALIPSLTLGKYDAIFGGLSITPKRQQVVDFTKPLYQNAATFIVAKDSEFSLKQSEMDGKVIGYQQGNTFPNYIKATYGSKVKLKAYPSPALAFQDLIHHRIDAVMLDKIVATDMLRKQNNKDYITVGDIYNAKYFGIGSGIAVKKGNQTLLKELDQSIHTLHQNGTIKKLQKKWHLDEQS
ncbi:transporter substrate-binding domain-containing protein [Fangia hongkongensis]|uniref:transporter substrate-binding domain-containing protein n=2 Tax=Fangia hongkongensis TaxID=270495 RepID=UPI000374811F|nr:transporter substrate-binding domain-containing protein [Fangia hongkongensis]